MRLPVLPVALLSMLSLLGGCHSSGGDDASATPTKTTPAPTGPACTDIWKAGATLPKDYTRCVEAGAYGAQDVTKCKDGTELVAYSDVYYAITGGKISKPKVSPMQDTPEYGKVYAACTGEQ